MGFNIRPATKADATVAFKLIHQMAIHDEIEDFLLIDEEKFTEAAFGETPKFNILIAEENDVIVAVTTYFFRYHIWFSEEIIEIDDFFVRPSARGHGIGNKLLEAIGLMAKEKGIHVRWNIERENFSTIAFYKRKGVEYHSHGTCLWAPENINISQ
ncbi:MAG: GNAT family N-acetyltransferase [Kordiimonadaceae bacterium]|nr:GNAT family N-acetyltransferase [Kordiimonadaceae bacterium]